MKRGTKPYILQTSWGFLVRDWNENNTYFKSLTEVILPNVNKFFIFSTKDIICKNILFEIKLHLSNRMNRHSWRPLWKWRKTMNRICGNKMPTRCNRWYLLQILLLAQHVSGTIMPIIRSPRVLYRWSLPLVFGTLVFKLSVWCGTEDYVSGLRAAPNTTDSSHLYNTLGLLMMGIMVPETCWVSNKICNKSHLLHLVSILFPQIYDDIDFHNCVWK